MSDEDWIKGTRACLTELYGVSKQSAASCPANTESETDVLNT